MSDLSQPRESLRLAPILIGGAFAGILYSSVLLTVAFLIPVQVVYGRYGKKAGLLTAIAALIFSVVGELLVSLLGSGFASFISMDMGSRLSMLYALLPAAILLASLALMNAPFWKAEQSYLGSLCGTALASAFAAPGLVALSKDTAFLGAYEERLRSVIDSIASQAGLGADAEALRNAFDVKAIAQTSIAVLFCSFAAFLMLWLVSSKWLGIRISGRGSLDRQETGSLVDFRLPYLFVWPFLAAWTGVLGATYFKANMAISAIAWNIALVLSLAYAGQGLGIVSHFMRRWNLPKALRICLALTAVILIVTPPAGLAIAGFIPLLGLSEVWIPYRNPKGV